MKQSYPSSPPLFLRIVMAVVGAIGLAAFVSGLRLLASGGPNLAGAVTAVMMGAAFSGVGVAFFYFTFVSGAREENRRKRLSITNPGQPWMQRPDWAARRITHALGKHAVGMWIWTLGWCGLFGVVATVNHAKIVDQLGRSWGAWAVLVLVLGCGAIGLALALKFSSSWWRYGTSVLLLDSLPAVPGSRLDATLEARLGAAPYSRLEIELVCEELRTITIGHGKDRKTHTDVRRLGHRTAVADPARFMRSRDRVRVPVEIDVPSGLPDWCLDQRGDGIRWVLRLSEPPSAGDYSAEFEVPVFAR